MMYETYMSVVKKAIGMLHNNKNLSLIELMADICTDQKIDIDSFAAWVNKYPSLKQTIEQDSKKFRMMKNNGDNDKHISNTTSLLEMF